MGAAGQAFVGPLSGVRVLDLTRVLAGPYCSLLLSQLGAEVIKIEEPKGDHTRTVPPFIAGLSTYFLSLNHDKKSIVLDLKRPQARALFLDLAERSDVVLENFRPGVMDRLGIGHGALVERNPRIITCSISGFGQDTSWKDRSAYDLTIQALGGLMSITGEPGGNPVRCGYPIGDLGGGMFATIAILAALHERERLGRGQAIDVSLLEVQMALMTYIAGSYFATGIVPEPVGSGHPSVVPYRAYRDSDQRPFVVAIFNEMFWEHLCSAIERPELHRDPRFHTNRDRLQHRAELERILEAEFATRDRDAWMARFEEWDVPCAPVNTIGEAADSPPLREREMIQRCWQPEVGEVALIREPFRFSNHGLKHAEPAPALGEHTPQILASVLGLEPTEIQRLVDAGIVVSRTGRQANEESERDEIKPDL